MRSKFSSKKASYGEILLSVKKMGPDNAQERNEEEACEVSAEFSCGRGGQYWDELEEGMIEMDVSSSSYTRIQ